VLLLFIASFYSVSLFIVFLVDLGVVLIFAASTFVFAKTTLVIDWILLSSHQVAVFAVQRVLELSI